MKLRIRLTQLFACLAIALAGLLVFAAPARATVPYTDGNGAVFNCRRVYFDGDGITWSHPCYGYIDRDGACYTFEFDVYYDSESALVPVDEEFYVAIGYHALSVETTMAEIIISDGSQATFIGTEIDDKDDEIEENDEALADIYRIPAGTGDVTLKTRGTMMGEFDPHGYFYPSDSSLPTANAVTIRADEGFEGLVDAGISTGDPAPIHYKNEDGPDLIYMWDECWAALGLGVKDGYDISNIEIQGDIDVDWGGGVIIWLRANDTGQVIVTTSKDGIYRTGENCYVTVPMEEDYSIVLFGLTFNLYMPDYSTEADINLAAMPTMAKIFPVVSARVYDPQIEPFFGKDSCSVDFQSMWQKDFYAATPLTVSVLAPAKVSDGCYVCLVNRETQSTKLITDTSVVEINGLAYVTFDTTAGELLSSYVVPFVDATPQYMTGWQRDASGAYVYYKGDGTLMTNDWAPAGGMYYYMDAGGHVLTNGLAYYKGNGKWYFVNASGTVDTKAGWKSAKGTYYYVKSDGSAIVDGWLSYGGAYYYFGSDGKLIYNAWVTYNGTRYYMGSNGKLCISTWAQIDGQYVYFNTEGKMVTNSWVYYNRYYYFMDGDGHPRVDQWYTWKGTEYHFNVYGVCDKYR